MEQYVLQEYNKELAKDYRKELGSELKNTLKKDNMKKLGRELLDVYTSKDFLKKAAVATLAGYGTGKLIRKSADALAKRKARKEADKNAESLEECMIDIFVSEGQVQISEEDMDFLLECFGYNLSEDEIFDNIINFVESEDWRQDQMEYELLIEDGEFFVADEEIYRLSEELELSEDEVMELISEEIEYYNEGLKDIKDKAKEMGEKAVKKVKGTFSKENLDNVGKKAKKAFSKEGMKEAGEHIKRTAGNTVEFVKKNPGKAAKAAAVGALAGYGAVSVAKDAVKALKKRKAKKEADREAESLEECMIDIIIDEDGDIFVPQDDIDFLLEAFDYELTESEVLDLIAYAERGEVFEYEPDGKVRQVNMDNLYGKYQVVPSAGGSGGGRGGNKTPLALAAPGGSNLPARRSGGSNLPARRSGGSNLPAISTNSGGGSSSSNNKTPKNLAPVKQISIGAPGEAAKKGMSTGGKIALGALGAAGIAAAGYGAAKLLKKRKAKKEAEKAQSLKECMIEFYITEDNCVFIEQEEMDFLLEAFEYELTESQIMDDIVDTLNEGEWWDGVKSKASSKWNNFKGGVKDSYEMTKDIMKDKKNADAAVNFSKEKAEQARKNIEGHKQVIKNSRNAIKNAGDNNPNTQFYQQSMDNAKQGIKDSKSNIRRARAITTVGKVGQGVGWVKDNPGKAALGAAGIAAAGAGAAYLLKKRKAKKEAEKANRLEECTIEYLVSEDVMYVGADDIDFLLEAFDYEVDKYEIFDALLYEAQDTMGDIPGELVVVTSSRELAKVEEKQLTDIPERVKDGQIGNEEIAVSTANFGKKEIRESYDYDYEDEVEYDEYSESFEGDHLIMEAILEDAGIELSEDQMNALIEANLLSERSIVRLDKAAKRSQAEKKALVVIAREQGDPLYKKLVKVYKMKNEILNKLDSKYGTRAIARVRGNARKLDKDED